MRFSLNLCDSYSFTFDEHAGRFSWICEGEVLDLGSHCIQRTIIDGVNLSFLCAFYLFLLVGFVGKRYTRGNNTKDWVLAVASIFCALCSIASFSAGLWNLIARAAESDHMSWMVYFVRGLVWISFTVSLLVQWSKWIRVLNSVWWVLSFALVSALNIVLLRSRSIEILDMVTWPINFILFLCALKNLCYSVSAHNLDNSLDEPLLAKKSGKRQTELGRVGFLSKLSFSWINPLLSLGYSKPLSLEDIPSLVSEDEANFSYQKFARAWDSLSRETRLNNSRNLVLRAIAKVFLKENIIIGICAFLRTISVVVAPLILYAFVNYSNGDDRNLDEGLTILGCLILAKVVESLSQRHWFFDSRRSGMRMRSALMVAVYQKQLKLSSLGRRRHSTGEIVNYIAVDAYRMGEFPWWFHSTWNFVLQLFLAIGVLFGVVGYGALPGLVPLLICGILNVPFAKVLQKCQSKFMIAQDLRLRSTSEILNNMKVIKLQSWEEKFKNAIESLRDEEFKWLADAQFKKAYGTLLFWMSPTIVSSAVFLGCAIFNSAPLNASTIFTVLATLRSMAEPVRTIPEGLSVLIQVKVSSDRLNAFLLDDELKSDEMRRIPLLKSDESVNILAGNFCWDPEPMIPTLRDVNLEISSGQKVAVCGPVGAGKSSLLYAILGEIPKISGTVSKKWNKKLSVCS